MSEDTKFKAARVESGIRQVAPHRWEVRVFAGRNPETGQPRLVSRSTTKGIKDARLIRAKLTTEVAQGKHGTTGGTFGSLLDEWLLNGKQGRAERTLAGYRQKIETDIRPALGAKRLDKLTAKDLDRFYADLLRAGKSPAMVMAYHRIITAALNQAEKWEMVPANVARKATPPSVPVKPMVVPPPERVRQLIDAAANSRNPDLTTFITLAALTGLRRGEMVGLRWTDVDWKGSALTVNRSVWQIGKQRGVKDPKTHQVRRIVLGPHAMEVLRFRWEQATTNAEFAEVTLSKDAYVLSTSLDGATPLLPDSVSQSFRNLCDGMEGEGWQEYHLHSLRHYTATELFRQGHHARTVADRLGHKDPSITLNVYTHDTEDQAIAAAEALEAGIAG
ncbi:MAG: site-specific integrase [Acidimicrobiales bacterium]